MKHLKLFEQFGEEESWWDEESPFDTIKDLRIGKYLRAYYILKDIGGEEVLLYDTGHNKYNSEVFDYSIKVDKDTPIQICGSNSKVVLYKDLPKEIKDRIK